MNVVSHVNGRQQLTVSNNTELRRNFRHEEGKPTLTGSLRKLLNEKLRNYYPSTIYHKCYQIKDDWMGKNVSRRGQKRSTYESAGKPGARSPRRRPSPR
jgi:hypothetical protein